MKTLKNILLGLIRWGLVFVLTLYLGLFLYFSVGWSNHYPKEQVDNFIFEIKNAPTLDSRFYSLYDKAFSDRHENITKRFRRSFWYEFYIMPKPVGQNWPLAAAVMTHHKGYRYKIAPMTLAFKINSNVPSEKCFDYVMTERYRGFSKEFKLNDSIINLHDTGTIIKFIIANRNPRFYRFHPTQFKLETDSLTNLLLF